MIWQPATPTLQLGQPLSHCQEWERAFVAEWCRLADGCADYEQTSDLALELYPQKGACDPVEVAREEWGTPG